MPFDCGPGQGLSLTCIGSDRGHDCRTKDSSQSVAIGDLIGNGEEWTDSMACGKRPGKECNVKKGANNDLDDENPTQGGYRYE